MTAPLHLEVFVPVVPKPKGNAQRIVKNKRTGAPMVINDKAVVERQRKLKGALVSHPSTPREKLSGAVEVGVTFVLPIPTSWPKWKQAAAAERVLFPYTESEGSSGGIPDRGNLLKLVEDCLEKAGWLSNDSQIVAGPVAKVYGERPGYELRLRRVAEVTSLEEWERYLERKGLRAQGVALA